MNGPAHYREAEALIDKSQMVSMDDGHAQLVIAQAQVHATLALAAATALGTSGIALDGETASEWRHTIARPKITNGPPTSPAPSPDDVECCASGSCEVCKR